MFYKNFMLLSLILILNTKARRGKMNLKCFLPSNILQKAVIEKHPTITKKYSTSIIHSNEPFKYLGY